MKIAVTATEASLDAEIAPRFGRCPYFLIVYTNAMSFEAIKNANTSVGAGAGIQSAQLMVEKGVTFVLTGNCGPNAYRALHAGGIAVITGCAGNVKDSVEQFKAGQLPAAGEPNVDSHFGMIGAIGLKQEEVR